MHVSACACNQTTGLPGRTPLTSRPSDGWPGPRPSSDKHQKCGRTERPESRCQWLRGRPSRALEEAVIGPRSSLPPCGQERTPTDVSLEFSPAGEALSEGGGVFLPSAVRLGKPRRRCGSDLSKPHKRNLKHIRHFSDCRSWNFP